MTIGRYPLQIVCLIAGLLFCTTTSAAGTDHEAAWNDLTTQVVRTYQEGRYAEGIQLAEKALQFALKHLGKEHPSTLISINNLALLYQSQGRYGEAEPLYKEALQLREKVLGKEHPSTLISINNLAGLYQSQGRYGEAEPLYKEALQLSERGDILGPYHPTTLTIQTNYIGLLVAMDLARASFRLMKQMENRMFSRSFQELYSTADEKIRRLYLKSISKFQDIVFSFALKYPKPTHVRFAAEIVLRWKQVWAEEYAFQHRLMCVSTDPDVKRLRVRMSRLRSEFGRAIHHPDRGRNISVILIELNQAEDELRQKARVIKPELLVSGSDVDRVMGRLPKRSALIEFRRFTPFDFEKSEYGETSWAAYLLLSDINAERQIYFENLGSMADLIEKSKNVGNFQTSLHAMFIEKFTPRLKDVDTLYIAPDGFLNLIPFASLKTPDGQYLAEKFQINRLQTGRDLTDPPAEKTAPLLAAFGGVIYDEFGTAPTPTTVSDETMKSLKSLNPNVRAARELEALKYLKYSLDETETIAMVFRNNRKDAQVKLFKAQDATEKALRELGQPPRILHLSTHGFFLENAEDTPLAESRPMILSGLALAGANLGLQGLADPNGDDGLLYSLEVLNLNLQGTELVSLSACETGKGVTDYSEGVYGLVRAFRTAGAKAVLMTLTPVGDQSSKVFMVKFYENWLTASEGTSPSQALHETRLHFINHENPKYRDPAFWSPYVLVGNG